MRTMLFGAIMAFAALSGLRPADAQADPSFAIRPGETIVIRFSGEAAELVDRRTADGLSELDRAVARQFVGGEWDWAVGKNVAPIFSGDDRFPEPPPVEPGIVKITFVELPHVRHAMLIVENGEESGISYRALSHRPARSGPTDVCEVMPLRRGYEHWPYSIDRLDLSAFSLVPWSEGKTPTCE